MAEVALSGHHRPSGSIGNMGSVTMAGTAPRIEMMPNPDFSFPMLPQPGSSLSLPRATSVASKRPVSMHCNLPPIQPVSIAHRRAKSTAAPLPTFNFNADDASGRTDTCTPPLTPNTFEGAPVTPSRSRGHRREGSQLVGGIGLGGAISSSPTKSNALPLSIPTSGPPAGRRGHAHRRSAAISSNDLSSIMQPSEVEPHMSSSLPVTPLDHPAQAPPLDRAESAPVVPVDLPSLTRRSSDMSEARPPSSRGRTVGFSDTVQYIPRPLSTISSGTESSISTMHGHSVNNSISSMLSLSASSPSPARTPRNSLSTTFEDEAGRKTKRSSLDVSKRVEKEGEWLRRSSSSQNMRRPLSVPAALPNVSIETADAAARPQNVHSKRHSLSHTLGLARRKSEPLISLKPAVRARLSATSLQEDAETGNTNLEGKYARQAETRSSSKKIRDWAVSKIGKRSRDATRSSSVEDDAEVQGRPRSSAGEASVPGKVQLSEPAAAAETNLDAVFSSQANPFEPQRVGTPPQPRIEVTPTPSFTSSFQTNEADDTSAMLDLDAALGPFRTPPLGGSRQRRELHSSRTTKEMNSFGVPYHQRTISAPNLSPSGFNIFTRNSIISQGSLPDVFEGEGEEEPGNNAPVRAASPRSVPDEVAGIGIQVVDADNVSPGTTFNWGTDDGLGIRRDEWEPERPTSYGTSIQRLPTPIIEQRRASSIIEETIMEEQSPIEAIEVVESHEEPRASSLTKSSDSSETPTLMASQTGNLALPNGAQSLMTPDTYQTSTFSSPDFTRRQGSFDTSRLGTSASSITDNRTMSSCTGDQGHEVRSSVDDVPSLTSSRSTMLSTMHANTSKRDFGSGDRTSSVPSSTLDPTVAAERRRKRASIQSLSQLVGGSFSSKSKAVDESRPQTAVAATKAPKKEHRLKKLMFWRSKSKQSLHSTS